MEYLPHAIFSQRQATQFASQLHRPSRPAASWPQGRLPGRVQRWRDKHRPSQDLRRHLRAHVTARSAVHQFVAQQFQLRRHRQHESRSSFDRALARTRPRAPEVTHPDTGPLPAGAARSISRSSQVSSTGALRAYHYHSTRPYVIADSRPTSLHWNAASSGPCTVHLTSAVARLKMRWHNWHSNRQVL